MSEPEAENEPGRSAPGKNHIIGPSQYKQDAMEVLINCKWGGIVRNEIW